MLKTQPENLGVLLADEGHHRFTYSLLPHDGRWWSTEVQAEADLVNEPLRFVNANGNVGDELAPIKWSGADLRLHALKPAEDGKGYVLRVSEAAWRRGELSFDLPKDKRLTPVDALERPLAGSDPASIRPFELKSFRL